MRFSKIRSKSFVGQSNSLALTIHPCRDARDYAIRQYLESLSKWETSRGVDEPWRRYAVAEMSRVRDELRWREAVLEVNRGEDEP